MFLVDITGNTASTAGGGITNVGGSISGTNVLIERNTAARGGGVFQNFGTLNLGNTWIIKDNTAAQPATDGDGILYYNSGDVNGQDQVQLVNNQIVEKIVP